MAEYYCGPQRWPKWVRKPLSRFYNRACKAHDETFDEDRFKKEVSRRRRVLRKAWKRGKVKLTDYVLHGLLFGYLLYRMTAAFGRWYKVKS